MTITHAPASPSAEVSAALPEDPEHERVLITRGPRSGLTIVVAVTRRGSARPSAARALWRYGQWTDALADALRLSQAMTMKTPRPASRAAAASRSCASPRASRSTSAQRATRCSTSATPSSRSAART